MRKPLVMLSLILLMLGAVPALAVGPDQPAATPKPPEEKVRELYVPFEDLNVLLEGSPERVLLTRQQYADLLAKAKKTAESRAPRQAVLVSADYVAKAAQERAEIVGTLVIDVLEDGLHTVGLDLAGVGLRSATLDGAKGAPIGRADDGRLLLFVEGKGKHTLVLDMVAPIQTTAARQILNFRLPSPAAARLRLTVPGDVEVKSGAPVAERVFDEKAGETRIELLPPRGDVSLVMSLNSRLKRKDRVVVARSVLVDEVTQAYERLHATFSFEILHRAVDQFRFAMPAGFEVTDVQSPLLSRWSITTEGDRRILEVQLREETTDPVVLTLSALRTSPNLDSWALPHMDPLDVVGYVSVVGLVVEDRLRTESIESEGLIRIDTQVLVKALPPTVLAAEPGAARIRPVVAYYAPQGQFGLTARFVKPPAKRLVMSNVLLVLGDLGQQVRGGFAIIPEEEQLFGLDFSVPAGWDVMSVTGEKSEPLPFERYGAAGAVGRVNVRFLTGVPVGQQRRVYFHAVHVPKTWLTDWTSTPAEFPVFTVAGATRDEGAIAVDATDDMTVRPETLSGLTPLDENEKAKYGLTGVAAALAYRYDAQPYQARLVVERTLPRITAQTYSFFRVERDVLAAHYELVYDVKEARTRQLSLVLPAGTPAALSIRGLDQLVIKEFSSEPVGEKGAEKRRWKVLLNERRAGTIRLAVDFEQRLEGSETRDLVLPVIEADGVVYQTGRVAVEGSPELDVRITSHPRRVDIGELVDAEYQPGRRLLGAFEFLGDPTPVKVSVAPQPAYALPPAIVQRAELATVLSADRIAQTFARFLLRTKALYLEVRLPEGSTLWTAELDGRPTKPQREGNSLLLSLPAGAEGALRNLRIVYETPVGGLGMYRGVDVPAPRLFLHAAAGAAGEEVPLADLQWQVYVPTGYRVVRADGNLVAEGIEKPELAVTSLVGAAYVVGGGVDFGDGLIGILNQPRILASRSMRTVWDESRSGAERADYYARGDKSPEQLPAGEEREKAHEKAAAEPPARPPTAPATTTPATPPPPAEAKPADPARPAPAKMPAGKRKAAWALEGVSSLKIDLQRTGAGLTFHSLGAEPRLGLTVVDLDRLDPLAWGLALAVLVAGFALTTRSVARKAAYILGVCLVATLIPVITMRVELAMVLNASFYAACLLIPYYLAAGAARWVVRKARGVVSPRAAAAASAVVLALVAGLAVAVAAQAAETAPPYVVQIVPPGPPVKVPDDVLILPYDPATKVGVPQVDRVLVPYAKFTELWNLANPDKPIGAKAPPAPYALAGATFSLTLQGDEFVLVEGKIDLDVYTDEYATIPLPLDGGVLARADLDGKPARLSVAQADGRPMPAPAAAAKQQAEAGKSVAPPQSFIVLYASGKGRHQLDLAVRMRLEKRGGWRVAEGRLPAAPATGLTIRVPDSGTEVRLGGVLDRRTYETKAAGEAIHTAIGADGTISVQWRPKVTEGQTDQTLTADSVASLEVREDQLSLRWTLKLEFRHGERDFFTVDVPPGYLVEKVEGQNVRGWELKPAAAGGAQQLEVMLLKRAKETEQFALSLWRPGAVTEPSQKAVGAPAEFDVPVVGVVGAVRHSGRLMIWRSPLLDLRTVSTAGVTRTDMAAPANKAGGAPAAAVESPLGVRPFQAYQFVATPFTIRLAAAPVTARTSATVQTILRVADRQRLLETRAVLRIENRPLYRVRMVIPSDLVIEAVLAPGASPWAVTEEANRKILTIYLLVGVEGDCPVVVRGTLGKTAEVRDLALPAIEILDVDRQEGDIVVQADPAFEVKAEGLQNIERVLLARVFGWLAEGQRNLAQVALHYTKPGYAGRLVLTVRKPDVSCITVTNSRVTDRRIEDAILLDWTIKNAGIREVTFLLPAWMKDARISVPLLRQKTIKPVAEAAGSPVRVRLELQDEVMGELKVLVMNDRLLTGASHEVPIPTVETGRTDRRYVAIENVGRDEVEAARKEGLEPLSRQQKEWAAVAGMLRGGMTQAFIVAADATAPHLEFAAKPRATVETVNARIGLSQAVLVMDPTGAYRAQQTYRIDNRTEQFLEIQLPEGASLWTAVVAGEPVKPAVADKTKPRVLGIPLVKTAPGDLDYAVVLKYGGRLPALGGLSVGVDFPLIRTVNINVELSQVELHLPETYEWFAFRGSMRRVTEGGEFEAGFLQYQNKQAERLYQTLKFDNPFAQARAAANLKSLSADIVKSQKASGQYQYNKDLQVEFSNSAVILENVNKEIQGQAVALGAVSEDNNDFIRDAYEGQRNTRARNMVNNVGANWNDVPQVTANDAAVQAGVADNKFNEGWLASNRLQVTDEGQKRQAGNLRLNLQTKAPQQGQAAQGAFSNAPIQAPEVAQQGVVQQLQKQQPASQMRGKKSGAQGQQAGDGLELNQRADDGDRVARYQQKYERQQQEQLGGDMDQGGALRAEEDSAGRIITRDGTVTDLTATTGGVVTLHGGTLDANGRGGAPVGPGAGRPVAGKPVTGIPAGLASLDFELPVRGKVFRFTTPRGDVAVRASAASQPLIEGLVRLAGVAVLVVIVLAARRLLRGQAFSGRAKRALAIAMILLGIAGVLFGVFPVAGVLAFVAGIVMLVRLRVARRRMVAA